MLQLSDREWAEFRVGDLLTLKVAKSNDKGNLKVGTVPFVGRSNDNNGLQGFYDATNVTRGKCITLGMVGTFRAFWQENDFAASQNILTLRAPWLNRNTALFICNIIEIAIKGRYSYGNSIKAGTFGDTILNLPVDDNGQPDYDFMEQYIAEREPDYSWATQCIEPNAELSLTDREWAEFKIGELFDIRIARGNDKGNLTVGGDIPFIGRSNCNNGFQGYYNAPYITNGNCITLGMVGTFRAYWQENNFAASQNILTIRERNLNKYTALFICNIIEHAIEGKYSYGHSIKAGTFKDTIINLPITPDGTPDYDFMDQYIKSLPFSKVLEA